MSADWKKAVDPGSQKTYYYNTVTKATSWDVPAGFVEAPAAAPAPANNSSMSAERKAIIWMTGFATDKWQSTVDASTEKRIYFNTVTRATSWQPPPSFAYDKWEMTIESGKRVYFNSETRATSWTPPPGFAADRWEMSIDGATGKPIYFNTFTHETSWTAPLGFAFDKWALTVDAASQRPMYFNSMTHATSWQPPPEWAANKWDMSTDSATGKPVYFNKVTRQTSWTPPDGVVGVAAEGTSCSVCTCVLCFLAGRARQGIASTRVVL